MKCPQSQGEAAKVGAFWICPEYGQLPEIKPSVTLLIFLSYRHDGNKELVRSIYGDLKKRDHDGWSYKNEINFSDEWRHAITDGILKSNRVLCFLSKHSTRDSGVCHDEIAFAIGAKGGNIQTILVESKRDVKSPPSISHFQWPDMRDWKERRATGEVWESWHQAKLVEAVTVVERDESRRFAGEIKTLEELFKPTVCDFAADTRIRQLLEKKLAGRTWLFEAVENWREYGVLSLRSPGPSEGGTSYAEPQFLSATNRSIIR